MLRSRMGRTEVLSPHLSILNFRIEFIDAAKTVSMVSVLSDEVVKNLTSKKTTCILSVDQT